jgi:hypothetical protein
VCKDGQCVLHVGETGGGYGGESREWAVREVWILEETWRGAESAVGDRGGLGLWGGRAACRGELGRGDQWAGDGGGGLRRPELQASRCLARTGKRTGPATHV